MFCRELFGKKPQKLEFGLQPHKIPECDVVSQQHLETMNERMNESVCVTCRTPPPQALYLMPSSSARCAQFPRAQDKVHFYIKLRELRDELQGVRRSSDIQEVHYSFDLQLAKGEDSR